jgi:hypothetical protein
VKNVLERSVKNTPLNEFSKSAPEKKLPAVRMGFNRKLTVTPVGGFPSEFLL